MPCPSCGGTSRRPIAPGYWECTTVIDDPAFPRSAWDDSDPWRAATHPKRPCSNRYQEGTSVPTEPCRCGIYSIGRCESCNDPVCGDHGRLYADALRCEGCARALFEADQTRKREAVEQAENAAAAERERLEPSAERAIQRAAQALGNSDRPAERLVAVRRKHRPATGGPGGGSPATSWLVIDREMGRGWYVGRFVWTSADGAASSARMVLTAGGLLLQGAQLFGQWDEKENGMTLRVRPGRYFAQFRRGVLAVDPDEFDIGRCKNDSLRDLTSGLLEVAAGGEFDFELGTARLTWSSALAVSREQG